jgi:hypothetical protein
MKVTLGNRAVREEIKRLAELPSYADFIVAYAQSQRGNRGALDTILTKVNAIVDRAPAPSKAPRKAKARR